eukprot:4872273-Pleurochrysis_carterae.AAC.1
MPCKAILHAQTSAEVIVTARTTGQAMFKCPKLVPARAATSQQSAHWLLMVAYSTSFCFY